MICSRCNAENETDVGSCLNCGAPLGDEAQAAPAPQRAARPAAGRLQPSGAPPKACPSCNTLNAATFKFCARCGTPLGATVPSQPAAQRQAAPPPPVSRPAPAARPQTATRPPPPTMKPVAISEEPTPMPATKPAAPPVRAQPAPAAKPAAQAAPGKPAARPPPPPPKPAPPPKPRARVSAIARDGSRSAEFILTRDETRIGRSVNDTEVKLDKDPFVAGVHATLKFEGDQLLVQDAGNPNGVFLSLKDRELNPGDELRIGRQRLRIEWMPEEAAPLTEQPLWGSPNPGYAARAVQLFEGGGEGDVYPLKSGDNLVGRGTGDVSFPQDGYVSSKHATLTVGEGTLHVRDMGSANGTYVRVAGSAKIAQGDLLLLGEQILRIDPL